MACGGQAKPERRLPSAEVEILVDEIGMAHVYAKNDEDLFFGYGYQLASDRLLQLEMFRRFAYGRLSEVLGAKGPGSAGETSLVDDRFARIFDWQRWGKLDAALMKQREPEHYRLTSAWVEGINHRIAEVRDGKVPRPFGFGAGELDFLPEPWHPDDVYVVQKMAGFGLDQSILFEIFVTFAKRLAPKLLDQVDIFRPARQAFTMPPDERPGAKKSAANGAPRGTPKSSADDNRGGRSEGESRSMATALASLARLSHLTPLGSNNWAVDGRFTDNGKPLLAGDPHLGYDFSGITYAVHLDSKRAGGTFAVAGFSFVGAPGIFAGHNDKVAWSPTSSFADVMDLWAIELVDGKAKIGGKLVDTVERREIIAVKDGDPDELTVIDVPGYGVVLPASAIGSPLPIAGSGKEALVGWTGFKPRPARYFRELMRVASLDEFDQAVMRMPEMSYNFVGADATGVSYRVGLEIPTRNKPALGREPWLLMDGSDPKSLWTGGSLAPDQLPHSRATARGWIATANNDPFGFTGDGRVDDDPWYYSALFEPGWRAARIEDELARLVAQKKVGVPDMQALQMDVHSNLADDLLPIVAKSYAAVATDPALVEFKGRADLDSVVKLLSEWDRREARESSGAVAFHAFAHFAAARVLEDDLPILFERVLSTAPIFLLKVTSLTLRGEYPGGAALLQKGRDRAVVEALDDTAKWLAQRFGSVDPAKYRYQDVHVSSMDDAYGRGIKLASVATDGGETTVNVSPTVFRQSGKVLDKWISHWGPIERQVMSFDADGRPKSFANFALGNVADKESAHFDGAMSDWIEGKYRELPFTRGEVEAASKRVIKLIGND
jgi:penicillin amidase